MIVVSDTSPINYLALIGQQDILPALFKRVIVPPAVHHELCAPGAPAIVRRLLASEPEWLVIRKAKEHNLQLPQLDPGEHETIGLAVTLNADLVLLDESTGREAAKKIGLTITGTIGVLDRARHQGLVDLNQAITSLRQTNFRSSRKILNRLE